MIVSMTGKRALAGSILALALCPHPTRAGTLDATASTKGELGNAVTDIVVTAQKRTERINDVPISITALTGQTLARSHINDYDDLSRSVPGLYFGSGGAEGLTNIEIRGISSTSGSATVGVYLDDVSITVNNLFDGATQPQLFDLDRVEVLRGPQGTLFGASSMAGTIRYVTKQPSLTRFEGDASADVSATVHGGWNILTTAAVNVPLVNDELAVRLSGTFLDNSGYIDNYSLANQLNAKGTNNEKAFAGRMTVKYEPSDDFNLTASVFAQHDHTGDTSVFFSSMPLWQQSKQVREPGRDDVLLPSLTGKYNLGFADLASVTGYFYRRYDRQQDGTFYNNAIFATAFLDPIYPDFQEQNDTLIGMLPSVVRSLSTYHQFSQELRLSSRNSNSPSARFKWITGLYYVNQVIRNMNLQKSEGINAIFQQIYGVPMEDSLVATYYGAPGLVLWPNDDPGSTRQRYHDRQYAAFGQVDWQALPGLTASIGGRYVYANSTYDFSSTGFFTIGELTPYKSSQSFRAFTPKLNVSYKFDRDATAYASVSKGVRLGGPVTPIPFGSSSVCAGDEQAIGLNSRPLKYDTDSTWNYELGGKLLLFSNKLSVNAAIYLINWSNIQQQIYLPVCGFYFTSNVGDARSYGGELEAQYQISRRLTISFAGGYNNSTITRTNNPDTVQIGEHVLNSPAYTADFGIRYSREIAQNRQLFLRINYRRVGEAYGSYVKTNPNFKNPAYGELGASAGLETGKWEISIYGKNLSDDRTIIQQPQINSVIEGYTIRPLTIGFSASVKL